MIDILEYIKNPLSQRLSHIDLLLPCIERGGRHNAGISAYCRGLLAHQVDTTVPDGHKIMVFHACQNPKCSNPLHLFWRSLSEYIRPTGIQEFKKMCVLMGGEHAQKFWLENINRKQHKTYTKKYIRKSPEQKKIFKPEVPYQTIWNVFASLGYNFDKLQQHYGWSEKLTRCRITLAKKHLKISENIAQLKKKAKHEQHTLTDNVG